MPLNFPEVWLNRVKSLLTTKNVAPFLDGIAELDVTVQVDDLGETNTIHIPLETFEPDVLINNTTYPIAVQDHTDGSKTINLDKYQTKATRVKDDDIIGASYDKIDSVSKRHVQSINTEKYKKAIHALAPSANTTDTPVINLTSGYTSNDVYKSMVSMKAKFDAMEAPEAGRRIVLSSDQYNKLLEDRDRFGDVLVDHATGRVNKLIAGFEVYTYVANPYYSSGGSKLAYGSVPGGTDKQATIAFLVDNVGKKTGITKQYLDLPNTTTQATLLNYRHYFITMPIRNKYIGAIVNA